ncbi:MAG: peptide-methionine (S)-S-oxide reductase MsrA [Actinomycetaceae bacterium]|nr:peptide-methionine (S)-S-oxide reductase MsrA [Actinomycetaceae bacterium]
MRIYVGMGCFWGVQKLFDALPGVKATRVGYMGGTVENPGYMRVCTGSTGHAEILEIDYDETVISTQEILRAFWENHDPTQGDRQGNDRGSQYRSAIYYTDPEQGSLAQETAAAYEAALGNAGYGRVTTEILPATQAGLFWEAEEYHQKYLEKNPGGYCPTHATGICLA